MEPANELPRITVVTPSYNQAQFLRETIESVLNQAYPNLEYFVIDGGSTDGSVDIIREYDDGIDWWVSEKDKGQTDAINKGFTQASGDLLCWVNSDDVLFPGCLEAVARCYTQANHPDLIHANIAYLDERGRITRLIRVPRQSRFFFFRGVWHGCAPSIFFGASLFRAVGGLNADFNLSMDVDIWMRVMKAGARVVHIPRYLGGFRWHGAGKSTQSLRSRTTRENMETTRILNQGIPGSTPRKRELWRKVYQIYQVLNLNYLRAYWEGRRIRGQHWKDAFCAFVAS